MSVNTALSLWALFISNIKFTYLFWFVVWFIDIMLYDVNCYNDRREMCLLYLMVAVVIAF